MACTAVVYIVVAYIVMAYIAMVHIYGYIVMTLRQERRELSRRARLLHSYGVYSHGPYSYGL